MLERRWQYIAGGYPRRSFAGLMALYETNYARLQKLVPHLHTIRGPEAASSAGALDLYLEVLDRTRYTTTLSLTYYFRHDGESVAEPDARIRIYHDARMAEVLGCRDHRTGVRAGGVAGSAGLMLARRWEVNLFLEKWLNYCLRQDYDFRPTPRLLPGAAELELLDGA
ncbi:MAG: DUF1249 domain-containing protein [Gammaproteobacteria bacterium]